MPVSGVTRPKRGWNPAPAQVLPFVRAWGARSAEAPSLNRPALVYAELVRRLPFDVQRDAAGYRMAVQFRNAFEQMKDRRGTLTNRQHMFWGFDAPPAPDVDRRDDAGRDSDDDGLAGSRVPRRPRPDAGDAAAVAIDSSEPVTSGTPAPGH